ncbi:MAG: hypothetical protein DHS20C16_32270 [Phycisphaerae bacterium]|nr:MAG: hypothetical protein DHS20C16_32270 [Phycisphaerae bacterium]
MRARRSSNQLEWLNAQNINAESKAAYGNGQDVIAPTPNTSDQKTPLNPELQAIIEVWPSLPELLRTFVLAIVRSGG